MGKNKERIDEINKLRKVLENEILDIQSKCKHETYTVGLWSWRAGSSDLMRLCTECGLNLNSPSDEETLDYNKEMETLIHIGQGSKIYESK